MRAAIAAAFLALVFHTMLYADFLEDPVTWALLGIGVALAVAPPGASRRPAAASAGRARRPRAGTSCDWTATAVGPLRSCAPRRQPQQQVVQLLALVG